MTLDTHMKREREATSKNNIQVKNFTQMCQIPALIFSLSLYVSMFKSNKPRDFC
jgi:hypothetical protein